MKFGLLFAHQIPPESGIPWNEPYQDMLRCLPRAEELGYVSAFQVSHHVQKDGLCPGPLVALGAAAAVTQRMRVGTGILLVPMYAPLRLAEDIAVLDNLSNGRFILGVAPGYVSEEFAAHGVPRNQRVGRLEETLDLMTLAWREERFSFDGRYFKVPEACLTPKPVQKPHPPIWYGVSAPGSIRRAARRRAVLVASPRHGIAELKEHFRIYDEAASEFGFKPAERPVIRQVFVAETRKQGREGRCPGGQLPLPGTLWRQVRSGRAGAPHRRRAGDLGPPASHVRSAQGTIRDRRTRLRLRITQELRDGARCNRDHLLDAHAGDPRARTRCVLWNSSRRRSCPASDGNHRRSGC